MLIVAPVSDNKGNIAFGKSIGHFAKFRVSAYREGSPLIGRLEQEIFSGLATSDLWL